MAHDVFVSYSVKDKAVADAIVSRLEAGSVTCWIAPRDVVPGADWGESIIDAIESSRIMILVFSQNANVSSQIKREVERAVNKGVYIIPFRVEDVPPTRALEYFISSSQWMDAFSPPLEHHVDNLAKTVIRVLASPRFRETGELPEPDKTTTTSKTSTKDWSAPTLLESATPEKAQSAGPPPSLREPVVERAVRLPNQPLGRLSSRSRIVAAAAIAALLIGVAATWYFGHKGATPKENRDKSIAVLPFENLSASSEFDAFPDEVRREVINRLGKLGELRVVSSDDLTQDKSSTTPDLREIGKRLGVTHVLIGSVQRSGNYVRLNVQLIEAATDRHVWADTFDRQLTDLSSIESEIAAGIANELVAAQRSR
jgi:TolB-like protein